MTEPDMSPAEIAATRRAMGLTQEWVAGHLNVTRRTVVRWETGSRAPSATHQRQIRDLAGLTSAACQRLASDPDGWVASGPPTTQAEADAMCASLYIQACMPPGWCQVIWYWARHMVI